jgi:3-hydroxyacyl-CoA dehydrogenase
MSDLVRIELKDDVSVITIDNPPVNALSTAVSDGLRVAIDSVGSDSNARAVVIACAGRTFVAGADIKELEAVAQGKGPAGGPDVHDLLAAIEDCPKPVVMAMHGTTLGGGLELAMAGHYRVASPGAGMGQPEVNLGIIPGAEGSQRLPRLVGVRVAIEMLVGGRPIKAAEGLDSGLIDRIIEGDLLSGATMFAREMADKGSPPKTRDRNERLGSRKANAEAFKAGRDMAARTRKNQTAPIVVLQAVEAAVTLPFDEGCKREKELAAQCVASDQARAMIHGFFAERAVSKIPDIPKDTPTFEIHRAAVIGAGTMGAGISTALVNAGIPVLLRDNSAEGLERGIATIRKNFQRRVDRGRMTAETMDQRLGMIETATGYEGVESVDLVIEAVFENMELKKQVFAELDAIAGKDCVLATNTSTLDINEIASATQRRGSVIGMHFFSPAHVMRLVEIVRGTATSKPVVATSSGLIKRLRKVGVVVGNCRGFVGNRMMLPYMREAQFLVEEGATPEQVDTALKDFGMAMGIFAVDDMGGIDLAWRVRQEYKHLDKPGVRVPLVLDKLYQMKRWGQKTGAGWFRYIEDDRTPIRDAEVETLIEATASEAGISRREITEAEIIERCLYIMINEAARILEEGHAARAADIDTIYLCGYGFPFYRGGPMWYADAVGLDKVLSRIREFHSTHGEIWEPAPLLEELVKDGSNFADFDHRKK